MTSAFIESSQSYKYGSNSDQLLLQQLPASTTMKIKNIGRAHHQNSCMFIDSSSSCSPSSIQDMNHLMINASFFTQQDRHNTTSGLPSENPGYPRSFAPPPATSVPFVFEDGFLENHGGMASGSMSTADCTGRSSGEMYNHHHHHQHDQLFVSFEPHDNAVATGDHAGNITDKIDDNMKMGDWNLEEYLIEDANSFPLLDFHVE